MIQNNNTNNKKYYGILIHGGIKTKRIKSPSKSAETIKKSLKDSISNGFNLLKKNNSAINAVEASVVSMESSGSFNAGLGSCLTIDKNVEMDASIMNGKDISAGSVGMLKGVTNPIKLARYVMDHTNHVMLVSDGAVKLARKLNMHSNQFEINKKKLRIYNTLIRNINQDVKDNNKLSTSSSDHHSQYYDTVGSVASDKEGNVAAAVSTGGRWLKMSGRIGDAGVIGSGLYADNKLGAACATGHGEFIMRLCLCKYACDLMKEKNASFASKKSISLLTKRFGKNTGGIITIDRNGNFGISHNSESMPVSLINSKDEKMKLYLSRNKT
ncbi:MAG: isoaspartyl peptidase/L-asparaginase family protein [Deltaproteobacteria bacterium]